MALAERADLVARLSLEGNFEQKARGASRALSGMEQSFKKIGGHAQRGLKNAASNLGKIGAVAGGIVALNVQRGIESLATLEDATTSVDAAIRQMGLTGKVTSSQIAGWANKIESDVQAAFDDKDITQAATTLIRFGKVVPQNLQQSLVVMTDLAAKTGDVDSAASLLAKALADPTKAAGKLAKNGVILTKAQQDQIAAFIKAGKVGKAQKVILDALAKSTAGAAAASKGPYRDALNQLSDAAEDTQRILGEGFLPVIGKVAQKLQTAVQDKGFMAQVREFGQDLADGFDKAIEFAGQIPWGLIGDSLKTAGAGAKTIFEAFTNLPPWVQQAVLTGWGLNKLTGGALGSIVGSLASGLIKGVLGINAGVVNVNAATVNGGLGGAVGGKGGISGLGKAALIGEGVALAAIVAAVATEVNRRSTAAATGVHATLSENLNKNPQTGGSIATQLAAVNTGIARLQSNPLHMLVQGEALTELQRMRSELNTRMVQLDDSTKATFRATERADADADRNTQNLVTAYRNSVPKIKVAPEVTVNVRSVMTVTANSVRKTVGVTSTYSTGHVGALLGM